MSDPKQPPHDEAAEQTIAQIDRAVDAVYLTANAIARVILLDAPDVSRLCVSAGLRNIEKLVSLYSKRLEMEFDGSQPFPREEKIKLQRIILLSANDCIDVMTEAMRTVTQIRDNIEAGAKKNLAKETKH